MTKAARYFSRKLDHDLSKSTVLSIKRGRDDGDLAVLSAKKKRVRQVLLGDDLDTKVQMYLKVRNGGGVVSAGIPMAAARGIVCPEVGHG